DPGGMVGRSARAAAAVRPGPAPGGPLPATRGVDYLAGRGRAGLGARLAARRSPVDGALDRPGGTGPVRPADPPQLPQAGRTRGLAACPGPRGGTLDAPPGVPAQRRDRRGGDLDGRLGLLADRRTAGCTAAPDRS